MKLPRMIRINLPPDGGEQPEGKAAADEEVEEADFEVVDDADADPKK